MIIYHPLSRVDVLSLLPGDMLIPHLVSVVLIHLAQGIGEHTAIFDEYQLKSRFNVSAGAPRVLLPGLVGLHHMILTTPAVLMAAFLATAILAMCLAVLFPHLKMAETSETMHPEMVAMLQNLGEAIGGLNIRTWPKMSQ